MEKGEFYLDEHGIKRRKKDAMDCQIEAEMESERRVGDGTTGQGL